MKQAKFANAFIFKHIVIERISLKHKNTNAKKTAMKKLKNIKSKCAQFLKAILSYQNWCKYQFFVLGDSQFSRKLDQIFYKICDKYGIIVILKRMLMCYIKRKPFFVGSEPETGRYVYVSSHFSCSFGASDFRGGICRISALLPADFNKNILMIKVDERRGCSMDWRGVYRAHEEFVNKFNKFKLEHYRAGMMMPDFRPNSNCF